MCRKAPGLSHAATPEVSPTITAGDQVPPNLGPLTMAGNPAANLSSPMGRRMPLAKMSAEVCEDDVEVLSNGQVGSDGDEGLGHSPIQ